MSSISFVLLTFKVNEMRLAGPCFPLAQSLEYSSTQFRYAMVARLPPLVSPRRSYAASAVAASLADAGSAIAGAASGS